MAEAQINPQQNSGKNDATPLDVNAISKKLENSAIARARTFVNVKDPTFAGGAVGDGKADDTEAMNAAHSLGAVVFYPPGIYKCSRLEIKSGGIVGAGSGVAPGSGATVLQQSGSSGDFIVVTGENSESGGVVFRDFIVRGNSGQSTGALIATRPSAANSNRSQMAFLSNVHFRFMWIGVDFSNSSDFSIISCKFFFFRSSAVQVSNDDRGDVGDSCIIGSHFFNGRGKYVGVGVAITQRSSGGLRILGNKFNGGRSAYCLDIDRVTSDLLMTNNSVENYESAAVVFRNKTNSSQAPVRFSNVVISGNQFALNVSDIFFDEISDYKNTSYWDNVCINNNVFYCNRQQGKWSVSVSCGRYFNISGNVFNGNNQGGGAIWLEPSCQSVVISSNARGGLPLGYIGGNWGGFDFVRKVVSHGVIRTDDAALDKGVGELQELTGYVSTKIATGDFPVVTLASASEQYAISCHVFEIKNDGFKWRCLRRRPDAGLILRWEISVIS
ncbi:hypothetical protein ABIC63_003944 [Pseudacidovorax sp. 1753]|uniref:glycosyl hydrolase family 28-related protein n=1 Tax=Pseudacidovorax sp. 1753 TaxID=3156419 RepID=UPI0033942064